MISFPCPSTCGLGAQRTGFADRSDSADSGRSPKPQAAGDRRADNCRDFAQGLAS